METRNPQSKIQNLKSKIGGGIISQLSTLNPQLPRDSSASPQSDTLTDYWLLITDCWLLVTGYWLLALLGPQSCTSGRRKFTLLVCISLALSALLSSPSAAVELLRIRVENRTGGAVEVSTNAVSYVPIGKVLRPAVTSLQGFSAACYVECGRVAATAVHGIRIKTGETPGGNSRGKKPQMISLVPFEFAAAPKGFGGHIPYESGIYTDIPAGKAIFRNFAPYVGNKVLIERNETLAPLPPSYVPSIGDVLVIVVSRPDRWLQEICFENKHMGKLTATYSDGRTQFITIVDKPVEGVGRYDGTSYTGRGRINTNHPGVLTISTAPVSTAALEGVGPERRGGFQIIPSYHALTQPGPVPQAMVVGPIKPDAPVIEGRKPLFSEYIGLAWDSADERHSFLTQVRIDEGEWEDVPEIVGKVDNAFTAAGLNEYFMTKGAVREAQKGVTHIRILFPSGDREFILAEAERAAKAYAAAAASVNGAEGALETVSGTYSVRTPLWYLPREAVVTFFVDGHLAKISASPPHQFEWNTRLVKNGEHVIDIRAADIDGNIIKTATVKLVVRND